MPSVLAQKQDVLTALRALAESVTKPETEAEAEQADVDSALIRWADWNVARKMQPGMLRNGTDDLVDRWMKWMRQHGQEGLVVRLGEVQRDDDLGQDLPPSERGMLRLESLARKTIQRVKADLIDCMPLKTHEHGEGLLVVDSRARTARWNDDERVAPFSLVETAAAAIQREPVLETVWAPMAECVADEFCTGKLILPTFSQFRSEKKGNPATWCWRSPNRGTIEPQPRPGGLGNGARLDTRRFDETVHRTSEEFPEIAAILTAISNRAYVQPSRSLEILLSLAAALESRETSGEPASLTSRLEEIQNSLRQVTIHLAQAAKGDVEEGESVPPAIPNHAQQAAGA